MNDDIDFERRLRGWLHTEAPVPAPGMSERLLRQTAAVPQRRGWLGFSSVMPAFAVAAVLAIAIVAGLQFGRVLIEPPVGDEPPASALPTASAVPSATPEATASAAATPSPSPEIFPDGQRCTNDTDGYLVEYPSDWYANEEIPPSEGLDGIPACRYFAPEPFEVLPNAGLPSSVAIDFQRVADEPPMGGTEISSEQLTVDGRDATVREFETTGDGFTPPGEMVYQYLISLDGGDMLVVSTDSQRDGDYSEHREVLDLMMETLSLGS